MTKAAHSVRTETRYSRAPTPRLRALVEGDIIHLTVADDGTTRRWALPGGIRATWRKCDRWLRRRGYALLTSETEAAR